MDAGRDDAGQPLDGGADAGGPPEGEALVAAMARAIAERASGPGQLDLNEDGELDVGDLDLAIARLPEPS